LRIVKLQIHNLRNLKSVDIEPHPGLNVLYGPNGAGKTSILESIVVLSRGRSFRTTQASELIGPEGQTFRVFAKTTENGTRNWKIGLERSRKNWRARKDGQDLTQLSKLTRCLPLVLMEPNSHLLVSGAPEIRRRYLDWGMFHVEQEFLQVSRGFSKILKQRNAALRSKQEDVLDSMDEVFCELGVRLGQLRQSHSEAISEAVGGLLTELSSTLERVQIEYSIGWPPGALSDSVIKSRSTDLIKGMTAYGPHRADIRLIYRESKARTILSRGEQKILAAALLLSQAEILAKQKKTPVLLLDDLASEFDDEHYESVLGRALQVGGQVWVSGTGKRETVADHAMFHVKHGEATEVV
jgi:DNA replication and repair protein RecF